METPSWQFEPVYLTHCSQKSQCHQVEKSDSQLLLHEQCARGDDPLSVEDDEDEVLAGTVTVIVALAHPLVPLCPSFFADVTDRREHLEHV